MTPWLFKGEEYDPVELDPKKVYGFVYLIEDLDSGKKYIGKKVMFFKGYRTKNKKRKRVLVESDWREYFGSNDELQKRVEKLGPEKFRRTILHLCVNKAACSYLEMYEQVVRHAILDENYYNGQIRVRVSRGQLASLKGYSF